MEVAEERRGSVGCRWIKSVEWMVRMMDFIRWMSKR
jgi:hypothetical protein